MNASFLSLPLLTAAAAPSATTVAPGPAGSILSFVPLLLIALIFYLLILRPQQQKAKEHRELVSRLKVGDSVVTTSGIYGEVVGVDDTTLLLKVAAGVEMRFVRSAVSTVLSPDKAVGNEKPEKSTDKAYTKAPERAAKKR
jgi:preprotein translocase subunit YajC